MPKMKTHSASKKRFNLTKTGKVKCAKANKSHILTKKDTKRTRRLRAGGENFVWQCCSGTFPQDVAEYARLAGELQQKMMQNLFS